MVSTQKAVGTSRSTEKVKPTPPPGTFPDDKATPDFKPVEFWNPVYPNEVIYVHAAGQPAEYARKIEFLAGYFKANTKFEYDAIVEACGGRVYTADTDSQMRCDKCGWATKSTAAFGYHIHQHA